jgi:hypothetical protein
MWNFVKGFGKVHDNEISLNILNSTWLINTVNIKLRDQFEQTWHSLIDDSPKANN